MFKNRFIDKIDVVKLLEHYKFDTSNFNNDEIRSNCLIHGGSNKTSFTINVDSGLWYCHSNCGGGDIFSLVERMDGVSYTESRKFISNFFSIPLEEIELTRDEEKLRKELNNFILAVKRSHRRRLEEFKYDANTIGINRYRSFSKATLDRFKTKYAKSISLNRKDGSKYELFDRILIPIEFNGKIVGISLRKTKKEQNPKWFHQPTSLKVGDILYNHNKSEYKNEIIVVEGMFDVFSYYEIGLHAECIFGSSLSHGQYALLLQSGSDIVLSLDGDRAGREGTKKALGMLKNKANLSVVEFSDGQDPGNITREELLYLYENRKK